MIFYGSVGPILSIDGLDCSFDGSLVGSECPFDGSLIESPKKINVEDSRDERKSTQY